MRDRRRRVGRQFEEQIETARERIEIAKTQLRKAARIALFGAAGMAAATAGVGALGYLAWQRRRSGGQDLRGKVVLITGGSRGLGFALAREMAAAGARLVICARDRNELDWARQELERMGATVHAVVCDVSNADEVQAMIQEALGRYGNIDILINNAGIIMVGPLESQTLADFQEAMDVMFWGQVYPALGVLPHMLRRGSGSIANITSIGGKVSVPHLMPYSCAKFAAVAFSEGLRAELAKRGIKVTTVVPGLMRTGSHVNAYFKGQHRAEYNWFALSATNPLTAMSGRRAARRVVNAIRSGESEIILSPQAKLLALLHGLAPGVLSDVLGLVNRVLPSNGGIGQSRRTGNESETRLTQSWMTRLGRAAGKDLHQFPEKHVA
jgi:short-subunit dehydrogenase